MNEQTHDDLEEEASSALENIEYDAQRIYFDMMDIQDNIKIIQKAIAHTEDPERVEFLKVVVGLVESIENIDNFWKLYKLIGGDIGLDTAWNGEQH